MHVNCIFAIDEIADMRQSERSNTEAAMPTLTISPPTAPLADLVAARDAEARAIIEALLLAIPLGVAVAAKDRARRWLRGEDAP